MKKLKKRLVFVVVAIILILPMVPTNIVNAATYNGGYGITVNAMTVYSNIECTVKKGSLDDNEGFTILYEYSNNVYYIQYSTANGAKEGYIKTSNLNSIRDYTSSSCVAQANISTDVYYGNNSSVYLKAGSVDAGELVAVISQCDNWLYIEYNTVSGRKRGYVLASNFTKFNPPVSYGNFYLDKSGTTLYVGSYTVYSGPTYRYIKVGSVSNENILLMQRITENTEGGVIYFIVYNVTGSSQKKSGFIFIN